MESRASPPGGAGETPGHPPIRLEMAAMSQFELLLRSIDTIRKRQVCVLASVEVE